MLFLLSEWRDCSRVAGKADGEQTCKREEDGAGKEVRVFEEETWKGTFLYVMYFLIQRCL